MRKSKVNVIIALVVLMLFVSGCEEENQKETFEVSYSIIPVSGVGVSDILEDSSDVATGSDVIAIEIEGESEAVTIDEDGLEEELSNTLEEETEETAENVENTEEIETADIAENVTAEMIGEEAGGTVIPVGLNPSWKYADFSAIHTGEAVLYKTVGGNGIVVGVNAGHGTRGGSSSKTYCHPDMTPKVTGGTTASGSIKATAVSSGMTFYDGTAEAFVTLREAQILKEKLLAAGYDVLMIRDSEDVQLDNVARTVICNNMANCHIAIHWDGDNLSYDKGCFYSSVPDALKNMEPVSMTWQKSEALGNALIEGLRARGCKINGNGSSKIDLTQTSFSSVPSVDIELGNAASNHDDASLEQLADGLLAGINAFFGH